MTGSRGEGATGPAGRGPCGSGSGLPRLLLLTDRRQTASPLVEVVAAAVEGGVRAVVLREKDLPWEERAQIAIQLDPVVHGSGGLLLGADAVLPACDGVHLPAGDDLSAAVDPPGLVGQSCHDLDEVLACAGAVDYVTVSPVYASRSKPGYGPALGADGLTQLTSAAAVPVYALGGIEGPEAVRACGRAGAAGVAVMGVVMRASRPELVAAELVAATEEGIR